MNTKSLGSFYYRALLAPTRGDFASKLVSTHVKLKTRGRALKESHQMDYDAMQVSLKLEGNKAIIPSALLPEDLRDKFGKSVAVSSAILENGSVRGGTRVNVDSIFLRSAITKTGATLISSPVYQVLPLLYGGGDSRFYRCDLKQLCKSQFQGRTSSNIRMTRLNVRYGGDLANYIESMTLYGNGVLTSPLFRDMVLSSAQLEPAVDNEHNPFDAHIAANDKAIKRVLSPYSCRLKWDDGTSDSAYVNLDRYGNFSFFLRDEKNLGLIGEILAYLDEIGALSLTSTNPLLRSSAALEKILG